ncbi:unnamed protein product [Echinostoma caproni]|uniref:Transposase n=1 Tax=Echinostoma caproni TaxID=27848 RepID=A0A183BHC2_9TREM|nr:unnamed protein product [Echinostoma caproni]
MRVNRFFLIGRKEGNARNVRSQRSKHVYAVEAIHGDLKSAVRDIIRKPPEKDAYDVLKAAILPFYTPSNEKRLRQLLARHPIDDTMLSKHLARLRSLAGPANAHCQRAVTRVVATSRPTDSNGSAGRLLN